MKSLSKLFSDDGSVSMLRVMALLSLLIGGYLAIVGKDASVSIFVVSAFAAKIGQKVVESKVPPRN